MATAAAPAQREPKFVVEHEGLGKWKRGDVLAASQIEKEGGSIDRLLGQHAMRAALEAEWGMAHVDLPGSQAQLSFQHMLAEKDMVIARQAARISELEEEKANSQQHAGALPHLGDAGLIEEKDRLIAALQSRVKNFEAQAAARAEADKPRVTPPNRPG
jgi:hypothetical protein